MGKRIRKGDGSWVAVEGTGERELQALDNNTRDEQAEATKWFEWSQEVQRSSSVVKALGAPLGVSLPPKSLAFAPLVEEISPVLAKADLTKFLVHNGAWDDMAKLKRMEEGLLKEALLAKVKEQSPIGYEQCMNDERCGRYKIHFSRFIIFLLARIPTSLLLC